MLMGLMKLLIDLFEYHDQDKITMYNHEKEKCVWNKWGILMTKIQILTVIQVAEIGVFVF